MTKRSRRWMAFLLLGVTLLGVLNACVQATEAPDEQQAVKPTAELNNEPAAELVEETAATAIETLTPTTPEGPAENATKELSPEAPAATATQELGPTATEEPAVSSTQEPTTAATGKPARAAADCLAAGLPEIACRGVTSNGAWTPTIQEFEGVPMALVPAGCFMMGNDSGFAEEQPVHQVCFDQPFWIDLTEVTVAQFARFLNGQDEPVDSYEGWLDLLNQTPPVPDQLIQQDGRWVPLPGRDDYPLQSVTRVGADAYCAWRAARLPTEAEWEYAARGPDGLLYPWGNELITDNVVRVRVRTKVPKVGSKPQGACWVGALDMSSSLFEWISSLYQPYPYDAFDGREVSLDADDSSDRVLRGSAWYHPDGMHDNVSATARFSAPPHYAAWYFGFRCARSAEP